MIIGIILTIILTYITKPIKKIPHGIELITIFIIIYAEMYSFVIAAMFSIIALTSTNIIYKRISMFNLVFYPTYILIAFLANIIPGSIITKTVILTIIYNIITNTILILIFKAKLNKCTIYITTNLTWNIYIIITYNTYIQYII